MEAAPSRTAMIAAVARALHRMQESPPWVLDDAFALVLVGPGWQDLHGRMLAAAAGEPLQPGWPAVEIERLVSRSGLKVVEHPARADLELMYFAGRTDGLRPTPARPWSPRASPEPRAGKTRTCDLPSQEPEERALVLYWAACSARQQIGASWTDRGPILGQPRR